MAKKIKDTDYLFLSTRVRALETQMLSRDRMEQMVEAKVPEDAAAVLLDCGYGDIRPLTVAGLNEALSAEQDKIYKELPGFDCGSCGSPTCRTFAEDVVQGVATKMDCIHMMKEQLRVMAQQMVDLAKTTRE